MQAGLRVLVGIGSVNHDRLQLVGNATGIGRRIGNQVAHPTVRHKRRTGRVLRQHVLVKADPAGNRAALAHFPAGAAQCTQLGAQGRKLLGRQGVFTNEKTVLLKMRALTSIQPRGQRIATVTSHGHRQLTTLHMQAQGIEPGTAQHRVVLERLGMGSQLQAMPGECRVTADVLDRNRHDLVL
ncbi:hypothetical protein D3C76_792160 [compost metagenome]